MPNLQSRSRLPTWLLAGLILCQSSAAYLFAGHYAILHSFGQPALATGAYPRTELVQDSEGTLYGSTSGKDDSDFNVPDAGVIGTVFKLRPDGTGLTVLRYFTNAVEEGAPYGGLVLSGSTLYGTTWAGAPQANGSGIVFRLNTDGTGF